MGASMVYPGLWVGSKPPRSKLPPTIKVLVLTASEYQPQGNPWGIKVIRCPIPDDKLTLAQLRMVDDASGSVANSLLSKQEVLCTCHMGLNRSALVACLAMCWLGLEPIDAIERVRRARGEGAMGNRNFVRYVWAVSEKHALSPADLA